MTYTQFIPQTKPYGAITQAVDPIHQRAMLNHAATLASIAAANEGLSSLLLPPAEITAWHEVGHAIMHAITGVPVDVVRIWPVPAYGGYSGLCSVPPGLDTERWIANLEPERAIAYVCRTAAGFAGEHAYSGEKIPLGSSIDEQTLATYLTAIVADVLAIDAFSLNIATAAISYEVLKEEIEPATRLHQKLLKAKRVGRWQLQHILKDVRRRDIAALVIKKAKGIPPRRRRSWRNVGNSLSNFYRGICHDRRN